MRFVTIPFFMTKHYHTCNFDDYICKYMCFYFYVLLKCCTFGASYLLTIKSCARHVYRVSFS